MRSGRQQVGRYPLSSRISTMLICVGILSMLLFVSEHWRGEVIQAHQVAAARLQAALEANATEDVVFRIIEEDALLSRWRNDEPPDADTKVLLAQIHHRAGSLQEIAPRLLDAIRSDQRRKEGILRTFVIAAGLSIATGLGYVLFLLRDGLSRRLATYFDDARFGGVAINEGADEIERAIACSSALESRLRARDEESTSIKHLVEGYIAFADQSLDLLHLTCVQLAEDTPSRGMIAALLQRLSGLPGTRRVALVLSEDSAELLGVDTVNSLNDDPPYVTRGSIGHELMALSGHRVLTPVVNDGSPVSVLAAPIQVPSEKYGVLICEGGEGAGFEQRQLHLLETVASVVAHAIANLARDMRERRMVLLEERNAIARELHDSLAQSLSYMKIQLARLQAALPDEQADDQVGEIAQSIREGIDSAYRQLRELLATFRTAINVQGLSSTLEEIVDELGARSDTEISIDNRIQNLRLSVNEELHVVQIIREALTNVARHAHANAAIVRLSMEHERVVVVIEDDGQGMSQGATDVQRYGLTIMRERARLLGGTLNISSAQTGSSIELTFKPVARRL